MSYGVFDELEKLKKKQKNRSSNTGYNHSDLEDIAPGVYQEIQRISKQQQDRENSIRFKRSDDRASLLDDDEDDIAPVKAKKEKEEEDGGLLDFFQKSSVFKDGYDRWDVTKTILGTGADINMGIGKGVARVGEGVGDLVGYGIAGVADLFGKDKYADQVRENAKKDLVGLVTKSADNFLDKYSVLGRTSDAIMEGLGQVGTVIATGGAGAAAGLGQAGTTALTTGLLGVSGMGSGMSEAYQEGATDGEALAYGVIAGASDALTELLFGGLGKAVNATGLSVGLSSVDDILAKKVSGLFQNQIVKNLAEYGIKAGAEGFEEVLAGVAQGIGKRFTYLKDEAENGDTNIWEILKDENLLEQFVVASVVSGFAQVGDLRRANESGRDFISGLTENEQKVVDKEYEKRLVEKEKEGKVSGKEKAKLFDRVVEDMDKGDISIDTIEEVLGGDTYKAYQDTVKSEDSLVEQEKTMSEESKKLEGMVWEKMTGEQQVRRDELRTLLPELRKKIADQKNNSQRDQLKTKLSEDVRKLVDGSRLMESYNEVARREQAFEADLNQYDDPNAKKTVENFMGVVNNTNKARAVVDFLAKIAKDTGQVFKAADAKKFGETALAIKRTKTLEADGTTTEFNIGSTDISTEFKPVVTVDSKVVDNYTVDYKTGKITFETAPAGEVKVEFRKNAIVNGNIANGEITVDIRSKRYLESIVGHEVAHVLEKTEFYKPMQEAIFEYAKGKGEYESRLNKLQDLYNGVEGANVEAELTADLVGDYLFQDSDFISKLSTENRNVFQKIYDEVKHLLKLATAGSEQARRLEQVKHKFDQAWKELGKAQKNTADGGVKHSLDIKHSDGTVEKLADARSLTTEQAVDYLYQAKSGALRRDTYIPVRKDTPQVLIDTLNQVNEHIDNLSMVMSVDKAQGAMKVENPGARTKKYGDNVRNHGLSPEEVVEIINNLDNPTTVIYETNRYDKKGKRLPNSVAVFVEYKTNGNEGMAAVEFENPRNTDAIGTEFGETNYHTVITVFEPDTVRNGMPFDYVEELLSDLNNYELEIKRRQADESATGEKHPNTSSELPSSAAKVAQEELVVKGKFSLSDSGGREVSPAVQKRFGNSKAVDDNGNLKILYHGTPSGEFTIFDKTKGSVEGDFGSGFYFTDNEADVSEHYEGGGPDFDNKVARRAEQIQDEEDIDYDEAEERAREELYKGSHKFEVYLNIENPAVVGETILFDSESYFDQYNEEDYEDYDDYIGDVEQLLADDIENIVWEVEKNVDVYSTDGLADVLYNAYYEGGIGIEELKSRINELYLEDSEGNLVGNEVTRQIIESLGYDGIIDPTVSGKWNMNMEEGTTHYIVFKPNQIKAITNQNPTDNPDIHRSLSSEAEAPKKYGDRATLGEEVLYKPTEEISPVAETQLVTENSTVSEMESVEDLFLDDLAPIQEEYEFLLAERDDIAGAMEAYVVAGDLDSAEQLMPEYNSVLARIAEIESDEADRLASVDEADAPVEVDNTPEDVADNIPLTKTLVTELAKDIRAKLGLPAKRVAEVRELIERYSAKEFPSKAHLYTEVAERFGTYKESYVDEELKGVKSLLRTYGISVDESIKRDIADYGNLMRSNFGKVRFSNEGLPVDVAYMEFHEVLPGLFPEKIDVPSDQLLRIIEVANMDTTIEQDYDIDSETLEEITDTIANGVNAFKQNRKESLANKHGRESFKSLLESADRYVPPIAENVAPARRTVKPAVQADPGDIAPVFETSNGQQAFMPEAETPKAVTRKELHENIVDNIRTTFREKGFEFDETLKNAKDLSTFATVDNTPQRVLEKALGYKEGQVLSDLTVNKVAQNETEGIKWLNSFTDKKTGLLAKISKQYGIKPGSKASAAAQMYAEGFYVGENNAIIEYGDKELAADFPNVKVQENIKKLSKDPRIRRIYDETLAAINESRVRNAYPEIPRLDNYFLHFRAMEDTFSRLGLPFNPNDIRAKDLPTDLNGVTADLKPGQPYFASAKHRTGKRTSFDLLGGLENYLTSAKNQIYHIDDIQTLRALRNYIAETYGQAHGLENLDTMSNEEAEQRIEEVYNSHLSTFAKFLNEEANVLAGKTSLIDRGLEGVIGRRGITFLDTLNKQVGANMVGFNVSSSLTNFLAPVQAFAKSNKFDFVKAMAQTASNKIGSIFGKGDSFVEDSPVMIRRKGAERFYRTPYQKVADTGYVFMGMVDDLSTELIARTKYNELTRKGMDSQQAHIETDKWVSRLMGDRSLGQQPQLYNSKMLGLFTKFQLEVRNQLDSQFYDTIQEAKVSNEQIENKLLRNAKTAAKITSTFVQLALVQHLFGKAFESVAGYNPAFDIIEALVKTFGWDDEEEDEDTVLDNIEEGFLSLLGDLPYTSTLTGGRIPIASALPVTEFIKGEDQYGNEKSRWQTLREAAPYYLLPGGYGQAKKTMAGMDMFSDEHPVAGSYTDSGNLRFPVEDTIQNRVQAGLFGQWASENARDYFDNERKPLKEKQIEEFLATGMTIRDYWDYREGLSEYETLEEQVDYIAGLDLPTRTKNILVNNLTDRAEPINLADYDDFSGLEEMDFATKNPEKYEIAQAVGGYDRYMAYKEDMKDMKLPEKAEYIAGLPLTVEQKNLLINSETDRKEPIDLTGYENYSSFEEFEYAKKNPESYALAKSVGGYDAYKVYSEALGDIKSDKDEWGESISGSRKPKVYEYIYSLDIPDIEKHILFKSQYTSTDDHNYEIVEYLDRRDDISWEEMKAILIKLDFKVSDDGTIRW